MGRSNIVGMAAACAALLLLAACGEKPQTHVAGQSHRGDAKAWQGGVSGFAAPGWKAGDAASWEAHMKARTLNGQNDYARATGASATSTQ